MEATIPPEKLCRIRRPIIAAGGTIPGTSWRKAASVARATGRQRTRERLRALVDHAHRMGYWIRFYTLDGYAPADNRGWDDNYNFGSRAAVEARWQAAIDAGVDLIATDQYEDLAAFMEKGSLN